MNIICFWFSYCNCNGNHYICSWYIGIDIGNENIIRLWYGWWRYLLWEFYTLLETIIILSKRVLLLIVTVVFVTGICYSEGIGNGNIIWFWLWYCKVLVTGMSYGLAIITIVELAAVLQLGFIMEMSKRFGLVFGICL